ncbi:MAG: hypothetical protein WCT49_06655 [Candidatus Paceibacterota bacterium]|jgi:hypothetical protein|nr:hypothetical protein [Candidatus Paceibacterota bacterium]
MIEKIMGVLEKQFEILSRFLLRMESLEDRVKELELQVKALKDEKRGL